MLKTPLEALLEQGLESLGTPLSRRVYGEEIRVAGSVDSALYQESPLEKAIDSSEEIRRGLRDLLRLVIGEKTDANLAHDLDFFPLFERRAEHPNAKINYRVYPLEEVEKYTEEEATQAIRKEKILESVFVDNIRRDAKYSALNVEIVGIQGRRNIEVDTIRIDDRNEVPEIETAIRELQKRVYTQDSVGKIYRLVIHFLTRT